MPRRLRFLLTIGLLALSANAACAQDVPTPDAKPARRMKLDGVCAPALERFCPALAQTPGQTRNQVICLKPYRSSLSLSCRSAVTAAMH